MKTKIKKLYDLFYSRRDVYAECYFDAKTKRYAYRSVKKKYSAQLLEKHVTDSKYLGIGIYPLLEGNKTKWISADFDYHSDEERRETEDALARMKDFAEEVGIYYYVEVSKSGSGAHVWVFFEEEIDSWKARRFMGGFLLACGADKLSSMDRFFPSQDRLYETSKGFGNLIHMPFSAHWIKKGTYFVINEGKLRNTKDDIDIFLTEIQQHSLEYVDAVLDKWELLNSVEASAVYEYDNIEYEYADDGIISVLNDQFIKWCKDNPKEVDYNAWIAMITNLIPFGNEGVKAVHDISSLDPIRYDRNATKQKILACEGMKPITYNWVCKNTNFDEKVNVPYKSPAVAGIKSKNISSPIYEQHGRYYAIGSKKAGDKELSTWTAEPVRIVKIGDTISRVWNIIAEDKVIKDVSFDAGDLSSLPAFKRNIMSLYHKLLWYGTENELTRVLDYLNQHYPKLPSVLGVDMIGMIKNKISGNWMVLTQQNAWDVNGKQSDYVYFNPSVKKEIVYTPDAKITKDELTDIRKVLFKFNELNVCATIVGWMCALFIKQRLYESHSIRFPVLMIHGQAGSGKSETARHVIQPFFGDIGAMLRVDDITSFAFTALGSSSNMFPLVYDEYKPALFDNSKIKMISKMIRGLYDNESSMRGQKDLSTREFKIFAPAVVIGESGFEEPALRERSADVFVSKAEGSKYLNGFLELSKLPLTKLGNSLLNYSLTLSDDEIFRIFKGNLVPSGRVRNNISMINTGLDILEKFYISMGVKVDVTNLKKIVADNQMEAQTISGDTRSAVDNILEGIFVMKQSSLINGHCLRVNEDLDEVYVHTPTIYPVFKKWARETSFDGEIISHNEFTKQLRKMDYYVSTKNVRMDDEDPISTIQRKVRVLDLQKLKSKRIIE
tara:strand:+ start:2147 stop:4825 length:2679 start_codon:yes stop_codon:yes gene_type:complete